MAVTISLTDLANLQNENTAVAAINANNAAIEGAFEEVLGLVGDTPNSMEAALDMNSHGIINLPAPVSGLSPIRLQDYNTLISGGTITVNTVFGIEFVIDGGGAQLTPGLRGVLQIPFDCTISEVKMVADQVGSVVLDVWKTSYANYAPPTHPVAADSITGSSIPTISSGVKYSDTTLTGWTTTINEDDVLAYNVNSVSAITRLAITFTVTKT